MKKLSRKQWIIVAVVVLIGGAILRSATNSDGPAIPKDKTALIQEEAPIATVAFDSPLDLGNGVFITVSAPARFTPTQFMSNIDQKPKSANVFNVTIKNTSKAPLDFTSVSLRADSGSDVCFDMLGDLEINGAPTAPLKVGGEATYKYGVGCQAPAGAPLTLTVGVAGTSLKVEGKIA
jgi:hypothetical protein